MWRKIKQGKGEEERAAAVPFQHKPCRYLGEDCSSRGHSPCKGPRRQAFLVCLRIRTEASGQIRVKRGDGDEVEGITEGETRSHRAHGP